MARCMPQERIVTREVSWYHVMLLIIIVMHLNCDQLHPLFLSRLHSLGICTPSFLFLLFSSLKWHSFSSICHIIWSPSTPLPPVIQSFYPFFLSSFFPLLFPLFAPITPASHVFSSPNSPSSFLPRPFSPPLQFPLPFPCPPLTLYLSLFCLTLPLPFPYPLFHQILPYPSLTLPLPVLSPYSA